MKKQYLWKYFPNILKLYENKSFSPDWLETLTWSDRCPSSSVSSAIPSSDCKIKAQVSQIYSGRQSLWIMWSQWRVHLAVRVDQVVSRVTVVEQVEIFLIGLLIKILQPTTVMLFSCRGNWLHLPHRWRRGQRRLRKTNTKVLIYANITLW